METLKVGDVVTLIQDTTGCRLSKMYTRIPVLAGTKARITQQMTNQNQFWAVVLKIKKDGTLKETSVGLHISLDGSLPNDWKK